MMFRIGTLIGCLLIFFASSPSLAQDQPVDATERARALLEAAEEALGGDAFLNVKTVKGRGIYSRFGEDGELVFMARFVDYIVYPDKERTEFGKGKKRLIQTNVGSTGWVYDGPKKEIRDQTPQQIENFKRGLRRNLDSVLRRWRQPDVQLRYLGEKEVWSRQRGRGVEIHFPLKNGDEEVIELYVDPQTKQPVRLAYGNEEDRFFLYRKIGSVRVPLRIDHYENGLQTARIAYGSIEFNLPIDPGLFEKPENPKNIR